MDSKAQRIPRLLLAAGFLVLLFQAVSAGLMLAGILRGTVRNLVPLALVGGFLAYCLIFLCFYRFYPGMLRRFSPAIGVAVLAALGLALCAVHFLRFAPVFTLPYDLGGWSETFFICDISKWLSGSPLYLPSEDSNSSAYTPGAPALSFAIASLFGRADSIVFYRHIQHFYLLLAALLGAAAVWDVLRLLGVSGRQPHSWLWSVFFACTLFLMSANPQTTAFTIYLHNDALALTASALAFWLLTRYAVTGRELFFWLMTVMPAPGFYVKQQLAVWVIGYLAFLILEGRQGTRRILVFGAASFGILLASIAVGLGLWKEHFYYWIFVILGEEVVSFVRLLGRFADASWYVLPGLLAGLYFLLSGMRERLAPLWGAWLVLFFAGVYTSGITYSPTHLGPASTAGLCFGLAVLYYLWPRHAEEGWAAAQWARTALGVFLVFTAFAGLGFVRNFHPPVSADLSRYIAEIEREFVGLPPEKVLLDAGDWIYLRNRVVAKDRAPILVTHRKPHYGVINRIRNREYARILVHWLPSNRIFYELGRGGRGIEKSLFEHYREVRRIAPVKGMETWRYYDQTFSPILVLEPIPVTAATPPATERDAEPRQ